ncbi:MAG TPA: hypothetical protein PLQ89_04240 [Phycisphaerae bacterium]|nr:hypothetical protein [Phycisphaerae bacterium]HPP26740.1 hypothetical protein [Phycisphaerae bacterium]
MAVAARPPAAGNPTSLKVALVVFVVLTVASLGFDIYLFTGQEALVQRADAAAKQQQSAEQQLQETQAALESVAAAVFGSRTSDPVEIKAKLDAMRAAVFGKDTRQGDELQELLSQAKLRREDPLQTTLQSLHTDWLAKSRALAEREAECKQLKQNAEALTAEVKTVQDQFTAEAEKIRAQIADLEQQVAANRQAWDESVAKLRQQGQAESERASEQLAAERKQRQALEQQLAQNKSRIDELVSTLASFRPSADTTSLLQITDGHVIQTVPEQGIVYISLGARDHIKPGMTFAIYSRIRGIPADGKGKATIKVNNVFDTTSECSITTSNVGDPIVVDDVIANPVYDRNRKFNFVVAGDFDLDFDGKIDDPGGEQVRKMIQDWGGQIQSEVDTRTDFVVLGATPASPFATPGSDDENDAASKQAEARKAFQAALQEAKSLGIPVLTRTQFLHFVGFGVPRNAKDDPRPM